MTKTKTTTPKRALVRKRDTEKSFVLGKMADGIEQVIKSKGKRTPSVGESAVQGLREGLAHLRGEKVRGLVERKPVDVAAIRKGTGLSQDKFAETFGLAASAVRAWEQQVRTPDLAAQTLLRVIEADPDAVKRALSA